MKTQVLCASVLVSVITLSHAASVVTYDGRYVDTYAYAAGGSVTSDFLRDQRRSDGTDPSFDEAPSLAAISSCNPDFDAGCNALGDIAAHADATATLNSFVSSLLFSASASADASGSSNPSMPSAFYQASADSVFYMVFALDSTYSYSLTGNINNPTSLGGDSGYVLLGSNGSGTPVNDFFSTTGAFASSGLLGPGDYLIYGAASSYADTNYGAYRAPGSFDLTLTLTAVPVPPPVWLFGSGLLGLIGIARRKKAA